MNSVSNSPVYNDLSSLSQLKNEKNQDEALKKVAKEFESIFVHLMLKNMRSANAVFEKDSMFNSQESNFYRDMYDQQMSLSLSHGKGLGIAETLYRQLKGQYSDTPQNGNGLGVDKTGQELEKSNQALKKSTSTQHPLSVNSQSNSKIVGQDNWRRTAEGKPPVTATSTEKADPFEPKNTAAEAYKNPLDFIEKILPIAKKFADKIQLNPAMMIAQAALETGWGKNIISAKNGQSSFNLFNIKAHTAWDGDKVQVNTLEYVDGIPQQQKANFRDYSSIEESLGDFVNFLKSNPRYEQALSVSKNPEEFALALQDAGYATDPEYANKLISIFKRIESWAVTAEVDRNG